MMEATTVQPGEAITLTGENMHLISKVYFGNDITIDIKTPQTDRDHQSLTVYVPTEVFEETKVVPLAVLYNSVHHLVVCEELTVYIAPVIPTTSTTLSGGESQRVKLATELAKRDTGKTLYVLDEPTTGLHFEDIRVLLGVLNKLVDKGNTIIVIEHNLDVIKSADYLIDMGPEGGRRGGNVLFTGTPEALAKSGVGFTAPFLKEELDIANKKK